MHCLTSEKLISNKIQYYKMMIKQIEKLPFSAKNGKDYDYYMKKIKQYNQYNQSTKSINRTIIFT